MKGEKAYIVIYSFMIEDLKLDPSSVLVFAYIYGFCLKYGVCDSSLAFISKKTGNSLLFDETYKINYRNISL